MRHFSWPALLLLWQVVSMVGGELEYCTKENCKLPDCYCGGKDIPGDIPKERTPQFVLLTFDDGVNDLTNGLFKKLFANRTNPNGCPIKATFYISHEWTYYSLVQDLYADGHEIASHTVTHSHGTNFDAEKWADEVIGEAEMLVRYAGVSAHDIKGMRAPFLAVGGDTMFEMLNRYGLNYDSSMSSLSPSWPYTLEYRTEHSCSVKPCPEKSHPGMWEVPMSVMKDVRGGTCAMADGCYYKEDAAAIQKIFTQNFLEYYTKSRAPFPLFFHAAWFYNRPHRVDGFLKFVDSILALHDVYFVTSQELINWVKYPVPVEELKNSPIVGCKFPNRPRRCGRKKQQCRLKHRGDQREFSSCQVKCPNRYPWVDNLYGE